MLDVCLEYITDYNICIQSAQRSWYQFDNPKHYCCFLINIQDCRKLLKYKICEVESSSHQITKAIHEQIKGKLSKILFIGDVCQKYKNGQECFNNIGAVIIFLIAVLFLTGLISFAMKRHRQIKEQLKTHFTDDQRPANNRLPAANQFLHSVKRVRFLWLVQRPACL